MCGSFLACLEARSDGAAVATQRGAILVSAANQKENARGGSRAQGEAVRAWRAVAIAVLTAAALKSAIEVIVRPWHKPQ